MISHEKKVVVTGAGGGLGLYLVKALMMEHWSVAVCVRNENNELIKDLQPQMSATNSKVFEIDLKDQDQIKEGVNEIKKWCDGKLHGLVNNAGLAHGGLIQSTKITEIEDVFRVNFFGLLSLTQRLHRYLRRSGEASIVNVSSVTSENCGKGQVAYGSSKAALNALSSVMAQEYSQDNILVNCILPAALDVGMSSKMTQASVEEQTNRMAYKELVKVEDVIRVILFLLNRNSGGLTGQNIRVDNGLL